MHQTNSGKSPKFVFSPTFIFCSPICPNNCGVVFFLKIYFSFGEMSFFVRPLKYANIHPEYNPKFPCVFVLFYREANSKSSKIYLLATMKYTWCAYLSPPFIGISRHNSLQFVKKKSNITLLPCLFMIL